MREQSRGGTHDQVKPFTTLLRTVPGAPAPAPEPETDDLFRVFIPAPDDDGVCQAQEIREALSAMTENQRERFFASAEILRSIGINDLMNVDNDWIPREFKREG